MTKNIQSIASRFAVRGDVLSAEPLGEGFINDTFVVCTSSEVRYILQRKNKNIFTDVPAMMDNIERVTNHLKRKIAEKGGDPMRETLTVIRTTEGELYFLDQEGEYWAMCLFIEDTLSYTEAKTPELAYQGGKGIGQFQAMLSDFKETLSDILPGFHNMRFRFQQWDEAVSKDAAKRVSSLKEEIGWIESRRERMLKLWSLFESGEIPVRVSHNDTKISNILFNKDGSVLCAIDLDTVLSSTCLHDYGDAIRCYTNTGAEDDPDLSKVSMSLDMFRGYTEGYLSEAGQFLNDTEKQALASWGIFITFEQVLRFLMDYINGDTYYKIKYADHNLVRTRAQYKLLTSMEEQEAEMNKIVEQCLKK